MVRGRFVVLAFAAGLLSGLLLYRRRCLDRSQQALLADHDALRPPS